MVTLVVEIAAKVSFHKSNLASLKLKYLYVKILSRVDKCYGGAVPELFDDLPASYSPRHQEKQPDVQEKQHGESASTVSQNLCPEITKT